jgi:putative transposase
LGYTVKNTCHALEMSRSGYYVRRVSKKSEETPGVKDADLVERVKVIKGEHPFWGYRRV